MENNLENVKLYCGDCLDLMKNIPDHSVDMVLCDLPYGLTQNKWDSVISFEELWDRYDRVIKSTGSVVLFSSGMFTVDLICSNRSSFKYKLIWKKNVPTGMASSKYRPMKYYEEICVFQNKGKEHTYNPIMKERVGKHKECYNYDHYCSENNHINLPKVRRRYDPDFVNPSDVLEFNVVPNRKNKIHPTQKPTDLLEYLIKTYTNEGDTVLDNCMGSGSTGVACVNAGRTFIGMELDNKYFEIAKLRIEESIARNKGCETCKHFEVSFNGCTPDYDCKLSSKCKEYSLWEKNK